ncbi:LLM class flavin-dependent oxidoreductase [Spirillospora sp. CA-128828]|uniref:LLM class flavin-dependent oxidoreductase n=1 Tax=Spirillospora sp. CA-128828 TaxID=3240033 RepID=UPI003D93AD98
MGVGSLAFGVAVDLGSNRPLPPQLRAAEDLLSHAEAVGVESVWLGESYHSSPQSFHLPSPLITLSHLAARTPLRLGTGVLLARAYDPARLAYEAALVDQISAGRLTLGLGLGAPGLRGTLGGPDRPGGAMIDRLLIELREAWSASTTGPAVPGPYRPGGPELLVGGQGEAAARRAARTADGYYAATNYSDRLLSEQCARYLAYLPEGRSSTIAVNRLCLVAEDPATALDQAERAFGRVRDYYHSRGLWNIGADAGDPSPWLVGTPETVAGRLERYRNWGVTHVQLRLLPDGTPPDTAGNTLDLMAAHRLLPGPPQVS